MSQIASLPRTGRIYRTPTNTLFNEKVLPRDDGELTIVPNPI